MLLLVTLDYLLPGHYTGECTSWLYRGPHQSRTWRLSHPDDRSSRKTPGNVEYSLGLSEKAENFVRSTTAQSDARVSALVYSMIWIIVFFSVTIARLLSQQIVMLIKK